MGRWPEGRGAQGPGCELTSLVLAAAFPGCPLVPGSVGGSAGLGPGAVASAGDGRAGGYCAGPTRAYRGLLGVLTQ